MTENRKVSTQYGMNILGFFMVVIFAKTLKLLLHDPMGFAPSPHPDKSMLSEKFLGGAHTKVF